MYTYIPSLLSLPPNLCPSHPSRSSHSTWLSSLCYATPSHQLFISHMVADVCQCYCLSSSPAPSLCVHKSILSVCISIPALQICSSVPFF